MSIIWKRAEISNTSLTEDGKVHDNGDQKRSVATDKMIAYANAPATF